MGKLNVIEIIKSLTKIAAKAVIELKRKGPIADEDATGDENKPSVFGPGLTQVRLRLT